MCPAAGCGGSSLFAQRAMNREVVRFFVVVVLHGLAQTSSTPSQIVLEAIFFGRKEVRGVRFFFSCLLVRKIIPCHSFDLLAFRLVCVHPVSDRDKVCAHAHTALPPTVSHSAAHSVLNLIELIRSSQRCTISALCALGGHHREAGSFFGFWRQGAVLVWCAVSVYCWLLVASLAQWNNVFCFLFLDCIDDEPGLKKRGHSYVSPSCVLVLSKRDPIGRG